jgi:4-diphosphocytidyl-2C-methyl-D-erythritol kinase
MSRQILIHAPAKLNLALSVAPRRADGMHPICSWMLNVNLHDDLELVELPSGRISRFATIWHEDAPRKDDIDWDFSTDLAVQAHKLLEKTVAQALPVQSTLQKRIPIGGGLGGGSADAAAMLLGLNLMFKLEIGVGKLVELASQLGSDVPFFIHGGSAIIEGLGEKIRLTDELPELHAVLVFPPTACATKEVYGKFDELTMNEAVSLQEERVHAQTTPDAIWDFFNDLAQPVFMLHPELRETALKLTHIAETPAHLTGSGSTFFVPCSDPMHAQHLTTALSSQLDLPCRAVSSSPGVEMQGPSAENA